MISNPIPSPYTAYLHPADVVYAFLNARYYDGGNGKFISQDPMFTGDPNDQILTDPQQLNSYSYAANNPITKSDPSGKYVEVSTGGTAMGFSGSMGVRFDFGGVDVFAAGGAGAGLGGSPFTVSVNGASLSHKSESVVSIGGSFTTPIGGVTIDRSGAYEPNTASLINPSTQKSVTFGRVGVEGYIRKEYSTALLGGPTPDGLTLINGSSFSTPNYQPSLVKTNNTTIGPANRTTTIGPARQAPTTPIVLSPQNRKTTR